jgi:hypothetical protein
VAAVSAARDHEQANNMAGNAIHPYSRRDDLVNVRIETSIE